MSTRRSRITAASAPEPVSDKAAAKSAARRVYDTLELRTHIFEAVGRSTLAGLLRLERAVTASAAEVLYKRIHVSVMRKMTRATARRKVYCDSVSELDTSPRPTPHDPRRQGPDGRQFRSPPLPPIFDPTQLLTDIATYRRKYPNLRMITHRYPSLHTDHAYVVRFDGDRIAVDLETSVELDMYQPVASAPLFPPAPVHPGLNIHHSLSLVLVRKGMNPSDEAERLRAWTDYLYRNPLLDRRVTRITSGHYNHPLELSLDDSMAFFALRRADGCRPLANHCLPHQYWITTVSPGMFRQIAVSFGPQLRTLELGAQFFDGLDSMRAGFDLLDQVLPSLEELLIGFPYNFHTSRLGALSGMRRLRLLSFDLSPCYSDRNGVAAVVEAMSGLGSEDCVYHHTMQQTIKGCKEFNDIVRQWKKDMRQLSAPSSTATSAGSAPPLSKCDSCGWVPRLATTEDGAENFSL